jgi:hypothetical protein
MPKDSLPADTQSGPVARNGLSLSRADCSISEPPSRGQRSWPATSLPTARSVAARSDPHSVPAFGLLRTRPLHRMNPVAAPAHGTSSCSCRPAYPTGIIPPSGSQANRLGRHSARLSKPPDRPSLPAAVPFPVSATDHRSRLATFSSARCSSNLLEPSSLCSRKRPPSKLLRRGERLFNNI